MAHDWTSGVLASSLLAAGLIVAQAPTDFSGTWAIALPERAAGAAMGSAPPTLSAQGDMGSGWGSPMTLTQDATALTVVYSYFHPRDSHPPFTFTYLLDGTASTSTVNMGRGPQDQVSTVSWQGASLVITTTHQFVNPQDGRKMSSETKHVLSLESSTVLRIVTTRSGVLGGRPSTTTSIYRKTDGPGRKAGA
jgi:hypothetical protein